jgi:hypothetical protein
MQATHNERRGTIDERRGLEMSNKKLTILAIIAVLMVIWAVVQSRISSGPGVGAGTEVDLIQGLDPADIGSIVLGFGEGAVTLKREGGRFVVASKDNYPAEPKQINTLLTRCLEIRASESKPYTNNPANHEELGVTEQKARSVVQFFKLDSKLLTGVIVGKDRELGEGNYVRLADSNSVYIVQNAPWFGGKATDYVNQELTSIKREDIQSVRVLYSGGEYGLKEGDGKTVVLENMPEGKRLKSSDSETVFSALVNLRFDDVKKNPGGLSFDKQFVCRLKDSTVYNVNLAQKDIKTYITCQAEYAGDVPVEVGKDESEDELKKKEAKLLARDKAKEFTARHQGWIYEIPEWKAKYMTKVLTDLLEDLPKPQEKAGEPNAITPAEPNAVKVQMPQEIMPSEPNAIKTNEPNAVKFAEPNSVKVNP